MKAPCYHFKLCKELQRAKSSCKASRHVPAIKPGQRFGNIFFEKRLRNYAELHYTHMTTGCEPAGVPCALRHGVLQLIQQLQGFITLAALRKALVKFRRHSQIVLL